MVGIVKIIQEVIKLFLIKLKLIIFVISSLVAVGSLSVIVIVVYALEDFAFVEVDWEVNLNLNVKIVNAIINKDFIDSIKDVIILEQIMTY
jgi:hypothetical protein